MARHTAVSGRRPGSVVASYAHEGGLRPESRADCRILVGLATVFAAIGDLRRRIVAPEDETIGEFLDRLGKMLKAREGVDADLAEIVVQHILTPTPAEDCVEQAMTAIDSLAAARTSSPKEGADG